MVDDDGGDVVGAAVREVLFISHSHINVHICTTLKSLIEHTNPISVDARKWFFVVL